MVKGIKIEQYLFRNDDEDITYEEAMAFNRAFLELADSHGLHSGGTVRFEDDLTEHLMSSVPFTRSVAGEGDDSC